jgi:hypothetical protein
LVKACYCFLRLVIGWLRLIVLLFIVLLRLVIVGIGISEVKISIYEEELFL